MSLRTLHCSQKLRDPKHTSRQLVDGSDAPPALRDVCGFDVVGNNAIGYQPCNKFRRYNAANFADVVLIHAAILQPTCEVHALNDASVTFIPKPD